MIPEIQYSLSGELIPEELENLFVLTFKSAHKYEVLSKIIQNSTKYITARHDGALVGFGRLLSDQATLAYINSMAVHPDYQKRGIGQTILKLLIEAADNVSSIYLYTNTADSLYKQNGFHLSEKRLYVRKAKPYN